jgi:hypothetical protein
VFSTGPLSLMPRIAVLAAMSVAANPGVRRRV